MVILAQLFGNQKNWQLFSLSLVGSDNVVQLVALKKKLNADKVVSFRIL